LVGTPFVELIAVMAKYSPFAKKAGMAEVTVQEPAKETFHVAEMLPGLGFDLKPLGSQKHVSDKLQNLNPKQLGALKETFVKNDHHPHFRREIAAIRHMPYGNAAVYAEGIRNARMDRMAKLVKIVGMLLQTKIYLFLRESGDNLRNVS
jgi:hypothetical protein